ncbi:SGNH/GDSL hydrolase family protein [Streptomyces roseolus]|uniref:SGNH/GDSL hydrolase family protein n=1 Tax=Streptomyces roseolus TaxID=67358 RepID=UPI0036E553B0
MPRAALNARTHRTARRAAFAGGTVLATALTAIAGLASAPASASAAATGTYVALGDSYAAGAGVPDQSAGLCLRSSKNYGSLVAAALAPSTYKDVTCAAAKVAALTTPQTDLGIPVNGPQLDAVTPDTTLVTLTMGGNDLGASDFGIADVVTICSTLSLTNPLGSPCRDFYNLGGQDKLVNRLDAAAVQLGDGIRRIHAKAPNARVVLVGYPEVIPADPRKCVGRMAITQKDLAYLYGILGKLNATVSRTAADNGAAFVDTAAPTVGHDACSIDPWIEGLLPTAPAVPLHPNARGERAMADAVLRSLAG